MTLDDLANRVRIRSGPETDSLGIAGREGVVYGFTTPSVTGVEVVGAGAEDMAIAVKLPDAKDVLWINPDLVDVVDRGAGTSISVGGRSAIRDTDGSWRETTSARTRLNLAIHRFFRRRHR